MWVAQKCKMQKRVGVPCQALERSIYYLVSTIVSDHCYINNSI